MRHPARWVALAVGVVVAAFGVVLATQVSSDPRADAARNRLVGRTVPEFSVHALDGSLVDDQSLAGKTVIVNFWNTWCIPCHQELPALKTFYREHSAEPDFAMIGIVRDDTAAKVKAYVRAQDMGWTVALDPSSRAALAFATRGQPETFAITPSGEVVGYQFGPANARALESLLAAARGR